MKTVENLLKDHCFPNKNTVFSIINRWILMGNVDSQLLRLSEKLLKLMRSFNELRYLWFEWLMKYIKYWNTLNLLRVVWVVWLFHLNLSHRFIHRSLLMISHHSPIRRFVEVMNWKKHHLMYNRVTQLYAKWCFEIFDLREFWIIECFCTSSVPNVLRPKSQLSTTYEWVCLSSLTKVWIQRHRWVEREFRRLLYQFSDSFIWTKIHIDEEHNGTSSDRTI